MNTINSFKAQLLLQFFFIKLAVSLGFCYFKRFLRVYKSIYSVKLGVCKKAKKCGVKRRRMRLKDCCVCSIDKDKRLVFSACLK